MRYFAVLIFIIVSFGLYAQTPGWNWVETAGGAYDIQLNQIVVDDNENLYAIGYFAGSAFFGSDYIVSDGGRDIFVAKMDSQGNWLWCRSAGGSSHNDEGNSIAITPDNCLMVTGIFQGTGFFGSDSLVSTGETDVFVGKIDFSGNWLWTKKLGSDTWDFGNSISVDANNYVYVTGSFGNTLYYDSDSLVSNGSADVFTARLNPLRDWSWVKGAGGAGSDRGTDIVAASDGRILLCGSYSSSAVIGTDTLISMGYTDGFAGELDDSGNFIWVNDFSGDNFDDAYSIVPVDSGAYVCGHFSISTTFDSILVNGNGNRDLFVAEIDRNGNWVWVTATGSSEWDMTRSIAIDAADQIYSTGFIGGSSAFGTFNLNGLGGKDVFVSRLDSSGVWNWAVQAGSSERDAGASIIVANSGNIYLGGEFSFSAQFGNISVLSGGERDCFIGKITDGVVESANIEKPEKSTIDLYPNPFNPRTNISFTLREDSFVSLCIYNVKGQKVKTLICEEMIPGYHKLVWNGDDSYGNSVSSGLYFIRLQNGNSDAVVKKCILLK